MKKSLVIGISAIALLSSVHRSPAPIVEEATPSASATPKPASSPKKAAQEHKRAAAEKKVSPFAGTWEGSVSFGCVDGGSGTWASLTVVVAPDASIVRTKWLTGTANISGPFDSRPNANGSAIGWTCVGNDQASREKYSYAFTLQRVSNSTATVAVRSFSSGGTCDGRAVLRKQ